MNVAARADAPAIFKVAVIGAGWAGLAAAVRAVQDGHQITVFEASRTVGGRARAVASPAVTHRNTVTDTCTTLDNGQHILVGAYTETLRLMRLVGVDPDAVLSRLPLTLTFPDGLGLRLPDWPDGLDWASPLNVLTGIVCARGWTWRDKLGLLHTALGWQRRGFVCGSQESVADLCRSLPPTVREGFIEPLCVSALNTPADRASGQVFLRVLQDALFGVPGGSRLLLPRTDLGQLFPAPAWAWLKAQGCTLHLGARVVRLEHQAPHWQANGQTFDQIILATPSAESVRLLNDTAASLTDSAADPLRRWAQVANALHFEAIATVYAQAHAGLEGQPGTSLGQAMTALHCTPTHPAQFVFDRGLLGGQKGQLAFVISASQGDKATLERQVVAQAQAQLGLTVTPLQTLVEKRATFACTPSLHRPAQHIAPGLWACGDYVEGPYPATLEGAVRSGWAAGGLLRHS